MATNFTADDGALAKPVRGEPWSRSALLVGGKDVWSDLDDCEARMQVRSTSEAGTLLFDVTPFLAVAYGAVDEPVLDTNGEPVLDEEDEPVTVDRSNDIRVTWSLTGQQTREDLQPGRYDLWLSDVGVVDVRATRLLFGEIKVAGAVTSAEGEA